MNRFWRPVLSEMSETREPTLTKTIERLLPYHRERKAGYANSCSSAIVQTRAIFITSMPGVLVGGNR